jgi:hypothetical protein
MDIYCMTGITRQSLNISILIISFCLLFSPDSFCAPPFVNFEGVGGAGIVPGAHLVNPPDKGQSIGKPAVAHWDIVGSGNNIYTNGFAVSFLDRFEFGYVHEINDFQRLRKNLIRAGGSAFDVGEDYIYMHNFHLKTMLFKEAKYTPAFAITAEFKYNESIEDMNENIGNALDTVGFDNGHGVDIDFSFSKIIPEAFYFPTIINANIRLTRGHYLGFLGFSDDYTANGELSVAVLPHPKFGIGAEIRQQNDEFDPLPFTGFTMKEDAFWDVFVAWFPNKKLSLAVAVNRFGNVVDKDIDFFVFNMKYDF